MASDPAASETGPNTGTFTVSRTGPTTDALTVHYTVAGTATSGSDYTALTGSVIIPAGTASAPIVVTPIDDTVVGESNETVIVTLAAGPYNVGSPGADTVTIADNDRPTVTIRASDASAPVVVPASVTRTAVTPSVALTVNYTVGASATLGSDYVALSGSVVIPAGSSSAVITVAPIDDALVEAAETVVVTLSPSAAYIVGSARTATVNISSND